MCENGTLRIWDLETSALRQEANLPGSWTSKMLLSPDGSAVVAAHGRSLLFCRTDRPAEAVILGEHRGPISTICATEDWSHLISIDGDGELMLWDLSRLLLLDTFQMDHGFLAADLRKQAGRLCVAIGDDVGSVWYLEARG